MTPSNIFLVSLLPSGATHPPISTMPSAHLWRRKSLSSSDCFPEAPRSCSAMDGIPPNHALQEVSVVLAIAQHEGQLKEDFAIPSERPQRPSDPVHLISARRQPQHSASPNAYLRVLGPGPPSASRRSAFHIGTIASSTVTFTIFPPRRMLYQCWSRTRRRECG